MTMAGKKWFGEDSRRRQWSRAVRRPRGAIRGSSQLACGGIERTGEENVIEIKGTRESAKGDVSQER